MKEGKRTLYKRLTTSLPAAVLSLTLLMGAPAFAFAAGPANAYMPAIIIPQSPDTPVLTLTVPDRVVAGDSINIKVVMESGDVGLSGKEVHIYEAFGDSRFIFMERSITAADGSVNVSFNRQRAGVYTYRIITERQDAKDAVVQVVPALPHGIKAERDTTFVTTGNTASVFYKITDSHGNRIDPAAAGRITKTVNPALINLLKINITAPGGSDIVDYSLFRSDRGNLEVRFETAVTGEYTVQVLLEGTESIAEMRFPKHVTTTARVNAGIFGTVEQLELGIKGGGAPILHLNEDSQAPSTLELVVTLVDENGFKRAPRIDENIIVVSADPQLAVVENKGTQGGAVVRETGKQGSVIIGAFYLGKGMWSTLELSIAAAPADIDVDVVSDNLQAKVTLALLDGQMKETIEKEEDYAVMLPSALRLLRRVNFADGRANFLLEAKDYGTYPVAVLTPAGITRAFTVTFTKDLSAANMSSPLSGLYSQSAVIFMGQEGYFLNGQSVMMSVPPLLIGNRVFVPVRFLTDFLKAKLDPVSREGKLVAITLALNDLEVIIYINLDVFIVRDGVNIRLEKTGAATFIKDNRVYVPLSLIARVFSADVNFFPKNAPIEHVTINWVTGDGS